MIKVQQIYCVNMEATIKTLETQIGQLVIVVQEQSSRIFPSDTEKNPRECKAITLRGGKELKDNKKEHKQKDNDLEKADGDITQTTEHVKVTLGNINFLDKPPKINHPFPYP